MSDIWIDGIISDHVMLYSRPWVILKLLKSYLSDVCVSHKPLCQSSWGHVQFSGPVFDDST